MLINHIDCKDLSVTLLVHKNISRNHFIYQLHLLDFCLQHYLLSSDSKTLAKVSKLHTSVLKTFYKKELTSLLLKLPLRVIPLSLALLYRYTF